MAATTWLHTACVKLMSEIQVMATTMFGHAFRGLLAVAGHLQSSVRHSHYVNRWMVRDIKRRKMVKEMHATRQRINAVRKNTLLPKELQEIADKEIAAMPKDSSYIRIRARCILTSRPRGVLEKWRLSRIMWRHLADYNQMSGITRSCW